MGDSMFYCSRLTRNIHEGQPWVSCSRVGCDTRIHPNQLLCIPDGTSRTIIAGGLYSVRICEYTEQNLCITLARASDGQADMGCNQSDDAGGNR